MHIILYIVWILLVETGPLEVFHTVCFLVLGAKYKFAQQWQIHCVSTQWLYDSVERGYCQSEEPYSVGGAAAGTGRTEGTGGGKQKTEKGMRSTGSMQIQF